jgi:hypothetical protein
VGSARGRRQGTRAFLATGVLLAVALLVASCSDDSVPPPKPPGDAASARGPAAQHTLNEFVEALQARSPERAAALGVPEAQQLLGVLVANARALDLTDLSARFVDESVLDDEEQDRYGANAWAGEVELSYRLADWDAQPTRLETRFVFVPHGEENQIAGVGGGDGRTPLWTTGPVTTLPSGRALVLTTGTRGKQYLALARQALDDVGKVLPAWRGRLVIEAPSSEEQLDQALAASQDRYANVAAVTTSVDGSLVPGAPVHVFLNPRVFDGLGPRGSQVVVSHETTHVATDATFLTMPTWLLEGFADYVALAHAGIPVDTAAAQILARIRRDGPPEHLPTAADLDPTASGLGATYEEAWLATRFIAREYGEAALVRFYRTVGAGEDVKKAFRKDLGTSQAAFEVRWRADLRDLATGVAG